MAEAALPLGEPLKAWPVKGQSGGGWGWGVAAIGFQACCWAVSLPIGSCGVFKCSFEKACITAIERTPTYCISAGDLQSNKFKWLIVGRLPLWDLNKAHTEQSAFKQGTFIWGPPVCGLAGPLDREGPTPLFPNTAFSCLTLGGGRWTPWWPGLEGRFSRI